MLSIVQIDNIDELYSYKDRWDETLQNSGSDTIFLTYDWIITWCKIYSEEARPFILLIKDGKKLIGIAPLALTSSQILGLRTNKIKFIGYNYLSYKDFIISHRREECLNLIFSYLRDKSKLWDGIEFFNVAGDSPNFSLFQKLCLTQNRLCHIKKGLSSPYIPLSNNWCDYWRSRGDATKKNTVYQIRRLEKKGALRYRICEDLDKFNKMAHLFFIQHVKRWARDGEISKYNKSKYRDFILTIGKFFLEKNRLLFSSLELNDEILATCFGFKYDGKVYYYNPTFDIKYAKYSPGKVLLHYMIKNAFDENLKEFDLLSGEDPYKFHWATEVRDNYLIQIFKRASLPQIFNYWLVKIKSRLMKVELIRRVKKSLYRLGMSMNKERLR